MLGGLYGDLPPPSSSSSALVEEENNNNNSSMWSSSTKMAPPTLRKPTTLFASPQSLLRNQQQSAAAKPKVPSSFQAQTRVSYSDGAVSPHGEIKLPSPPYQPALVGVTSTVMEEYDPCRPNDYEEYRRERRRRAMEAEMRKEMERRRQEEEERERELMALRELEEAADKENEIAESRTVALNISGEEAWKRRAAMGAGGGRADVSSPVVIQPRSPSPPPNGDGFMIGKSATGGLGVGAGGHMTAAQRMMARMGWKEGQGLGKQEQGITTPLMARKTDKRAGVIVNASESRPEKKIKGANITGPPTRVLLLRNMIHGSEDS